MNYRKEIEWLREYQKSPEHLRNKKNREEREARELDGNTSK